MFRSGIIAAIVTALGAFAGTADAASISYGPKSAGGRGPLITFTNLAAPTAITGDAVITFTVNGDLDYYGEYVDVSIDGFSLGRVFDNNTSNDPFNVSGDRGNQSQSNITATATIANADFAPLISDGSLNLSFDFSSYVDYAGTVNTLYGSITYNSTIVTSSNESAPAPVPLPAGMPLMLAGLAAFGIARQKLKRAS